MSDIVFARARVRRVLQTTLAVALVGGVVAAGGTPAVAAPEKVLQSVAITLGSDSTISGVTTTTVRAGEDDELSSDSASFDPNAVAGELPVRVLTSYRLGDRAGTDLSDIEGEAGRVVIDVTVQNVTARPEQVVYNFDGAQRRQNALVATPLTVVASADLGEDALGSVVTADDVRPGDVTNGVLGGNAGRSADVQWAALLAPPRLGASATFRLVQDTDDFRVPTFDLSVQPGLVTDPSVQALLEAAFSEDPSSTLQLETATIELVSNVNTTLTSASTVLARIQRELGSTASTLGQKTIADLESSASLVSSSLSGLAGDIDDLSSQMGSEMRTAQSETVEQFEQTIGSMKTLLGDPRDFDAQPTADDDLVCGSRLPDPAKATSITEQMMAATAQLSAIKVATQDCREEIKRGLAASIGELDDTAADETVMGTLRATQDGLVGQVAALETARQDLKRGFDGSLLGRFGSSVSVFADLVGEVRTAAAPIGDPDTDLPDLVSALDDIEDLLVGLQQELDSDEGLEDVFDDVHAAAVAERGAWLAEDPRDQARAAADLACDLAAGPGTGGVVDRGGYHEVSLVLTGADCDGDVAAPGTRFGGHHETFSDDLVGRMETTYGVLDAVASLTDTDNAASPAAAALRSVRADLADVRAAVDALQEDPQLPKRGELRTLLRVIFQLEDGATPSFGADGPVWPYPRDVDFQDADPTSEACVRITAFDLPLTPDPVPAGYVEADPLDVMMLFYAKLACNQANIDEDIDLAFEGGTQALLATGSELEEDKARIDGARRSAEDDVDTLVDTLTDALDRSVESIRSRGRKAVSDQVVRLDSERDRLEAVLDEQVARSLRRIEGTVADSNRNLVAAEKALRADLDEVLLDLGTRDEAGTGLLGALVKGAADTGTATEGVVRANATTSEFAGVRSTALADVYLQQAQLSRSLELLEAYPAFGTELPAGSSHLTIFTFQMGGS